MVYTQYLGKEIDEQGGNSRAQTYPFQLRLNQGPELRTQHPAPSTVSPAFNTQQSASGQQVQFTAEQLLSILSPRS